MSRDKIEQKKFNKGFMTKYIIINEINIKYDIKIKCKNMKLKNK